MKYFNISILFLIGLLVSNCTSNPDLEDGNPNIDLPPTIPTITTVTPSEITLSSAVSGGIIATDGGSPILAKGIIWSITENPTVALPTKTNDGQGLESFTSEITDLESNTTYYIRAYARNINGTAYGEQLEFTTPIDENELPKVTTAATTDITTNSVRTGGTVVGNGILPVTERGVVWSLSPNPVLTPTAFFASNGLGLGNFSITLTNLTPNTTYYLRAYAKSDYGLGYGEEVSFTTSPLLYTTGNGVTAVDGTTYGSVIINNQEWSTQNLNVTRYRNGDLIPQVQNPTEWANITTGAWCFYAYSTANGTVYGKLYNWFAVNDPRGLAPTGWHVPNNNEWISLQDFLGGSQEAGGFMKKTGTSEWQSPNTGATNASGFTGLPGGYCLANGSFSSIGTIGYWWVASEYNSANAWCTGLYSNTKTITRAPIDKNQGFAVRIVKD